MAFILYFIKWFDQMRKGESEGLVIDGSGGMRKRERGESEGLMIGGSGGMVWPVAMEAWGKGREVRVRANEKKRKWGESRDKEKEKIIKILNTHVTVTIRAVHDPPGPDKPPGTRSSSPETARSKLGFGQMRVAGAWTREHRFELRVGF